MTTTITAHVNEVTRVRRTADGRYVLKNGQATDYYDISKKDEYATTTFNTFNTYAVSGVSGVTKDGYLSLVQLVMALCLQRATDIENTSLVKYMEDLAVNTAQINAITMVEDKLAAKADGKSTVSTYFSELFTDEEMNLFNQYSNNGYGKSGGTYWDYWLRDVAKLSDFSITGSVASADYVIDTLTKIDTQLDSLNSISQQLLITLQSETSRRDQAYDLVTAVAKSINSVLMSVANNVR